MVKCIKCVKLLSKKAPGLQCGKCSKWFHATCASILHEQLIAINSTESVDWKCKTCSGGAKVKRVSCIMPDIEDDTDTELATPNTQTGDIKHQLLHDIRVEVREIIREELQRTLKFYSDKIDEYERKIQLYDKALKNVENRCTDLQNNWKNINIKYEVLENKINQLEQLQVANQVEICGIMEMENENTGEIVKKIADLIQQRREDIVKVYRRKKRYTNSSSRKNFITPITVVLREGIRDMWLDSAKKSQLSAATLGPNVGEKVYLRESLTPATAYLLWKTKNELSGLFDYIWCKHGNILARKSEKEKQIYTIRSTADIEKVKSSHLTCE